MENKFFGCQKRMSFEILDEVKPLLDPKPNCSYYRFLSAEKKLAITLHYVKDTGSLWMTAKYIWNPSMHSSQNDR